jgi:hypothetical protein
MPRVGFEPTTSVFEREKTVHALDRAVTRSDNKIMQQLQKQMGKDQCSYRPTRLSNSERILDLSFLRR